MISRQTVLTYLGVVVRNLFSPIVVVILVLAGFLLIIGQRADALFVGGTAILNGLIGLIQEIRAKLALAKLEIMTAVTARLVLPSDMLKEVAISSLIKGNLIEIRLGDQIPVDGIVRKHTSVMVDEALLTGESNPIQKQAGETVYAGSLVTAGTAVIEVSAVGKATKTEKMTLKLKWLDDRLTPFSATW